ncbi:MAG: protein kinase [Proteobacteria bacterium]|nr:protein kinase [Pseudomonadota bacterium]MBS0461231.1 protein kinase [Pseudomonadota bacterium]MBS0463830.1 protein kinase [Pseudomonadota bacterium]
MPRPASPPADATGQNGIAQSAERAFPKIAGYRISKRLGEGGMAAVFLATQQSLDRPVAIKVMERAGLQDEVSKQRFENEARTIAQLSHPCIVAIYEVGRTSDGRMYYIMPFLANGDLSQRDLRNDEAAILGVLRALLSALGYAHQRGIVHRDVKAANVLFDVADRPLLTDFGIAMSKRDTSRITTAGIAVGSSGYMAPEQARGDVVDGRADLYSVGVLAYELLTGRLPYQAPDALALALMHAQNPIPRLPAQKRHWQFFIDKAMAKSADQRYASAQQMLDATTRIERRQHSRHAGTAGVWRQPRALAALGGVALLAGGIYTLRNHLPWHGAETGAVERTNAPASGKSGFVTLASARADTRAASAAATPTPAADVPASALGAAAEQSPDNTVLTAAREAIAHGNLTAPADNNAIDLTRMAWKLSPDSVDARTLAADVLKALAERQAQAIVEHHDPRVLDDRLKSLQLADATIGRDAPVARTIRATLANAIQRRVQAESSINDTAALKRTESLARQIDLGEVYRQSVAEAQRRSGASATAGSAALAALGAGWVALPQANPRSAPSAIARAQITRHEYAEFVNATRRPASTCSGSKPAPAGGRKTWSDPGFAVASDQTVVCVSWNDANAYAAWLGAQKGQHYRLATAADWQAAKTAGGIGGTHPEWLLDRGIAGRDGGAHDGTQGFDDVGFRVVRVLDGKR